jgi:hypothetical protein
MNTRKSFAVVSVVLVVLLGGLDGYLIPEKKRSLELLAELRARQDALQRALIRTEKIAGEAEAARARLAAQAATLASAPVPAVAAVRPKMRNAGDIMKKYPEVQAAFFASRRVSQQQGYGPLFFALGLSSEQQNKLLDVMVAKMNDLQDLATAAQALGKSLTDPAYAATAKALDAREEADETSLLGSAGFQTLQDYRRALRAWDMATRYAVSVDEADSVSPQQAGQLARTVAGASPQYAQGGVVDPVTVDWSLVDRQAAGFLTPAQLTAWQQNGERLRAELQASFNRALATEAAPPPQN